MMRLLALLFALALIVLVARALFRLTGLRQGFSGGRFPW